MRVYITDHAREQIKKRWPVKDIEPYELVLEAYDRGRQMNDRELQVFFNKWSNKSFGFFPEVRIYKGFEFFFEQEPGILRFVTLYKPYSNNKHKK